MKFFVLFAFLVLTSCEHTAGSMGTCYDGMFNSFCVVNTPPGTTLATGMGIMPAIGSMLGGVGAMMLGEGSIVTGVATVTHP